MVTPSIIININPPGLARHKNNIKMTNINNQSGLKKQECRENGWTGSRFYTFELSVIIANIRDWLKKTYPNYTFSVNSKDYRLINVVIRSLDFNPFDGEQCDYLKIANYLWRPEYCNELNDRAKALVSAIWDYVNSYNYNDSDVMTDYHDVNFYASISLGSLKSPFKVDVLRFSHTKDTATASQPAEKTEGAAPESDTTPAKGLRLVDIANGVAVEADDWRTTYFNRRAIKAHGCHWNKEAKQWQATDADAIAALRAWFGQDCTTKDGNEPETLQSCNTASGPIEAPVIPSVENHQSKACADAAPAEAVADDNTTTKPTGVLPDWLRVGNIVRVGPYACQIDEVDLSRDTVTYHCEVDGAPVVVQSIEYFVRQKENTRVAEINIPDWLSVGSRVVWLGQVHTVSALCPSSCTRTGYFVMFEGCDDWADPSAITSYTSPDAPPDPAGGGIPDDGTAPKHVSADYSASPDSPVFVLATEKCNIDTCTKVSSLEDVDLLYRHGINLCKGCNFEFAASCTEERLTTCNLQLKALL